MNNRKIFLLLVIKKWIMEKYSYYLVILLLLSLYKKGILQYYTILFIDHQFQLIYNSYFLTSWIIGIIIVFLYYKLYKYL